MTVRTLLHLAIGYTVRNSPAVRGISAGVELDIAGPLRGSRKIDKGVAIDEERAIVVAGEGDREGRRTEVAGEGLKVVRCLAGKEIDVAGCDEGGE